MCRSVMGQSADTQSKLHRESDELSELARQFDEARDLLVSLMSWHTLDQLSTVLNLPGTL